MLLTWARFTGLVNVLPDGSVSPLVDRETAESQPYFMFNAAGKNIDCTQGLGMRCLAWNGDGHCSWVFYDLPNTNSRRFITLGWAPDEEDKNLLKKAIRG